MKKKSNKDIYECQKCGNHAISLYWNKEIKKWVCPDCFKKLNGGENDEKIEYKEQ
jgi:ribosomal protein L37AE/L43A